MGKVGSSRVGVDVGTGGGGSGGCGLVESVGKEVDVGGPGGVGAGGAGGYCGGCPGTFCWLGVGRAVVGVGADG